MFWNFLIFEFLFLAILTFEIIRSLESNKEVIEGMHFVKNLMENVRNLLLYRKYGEHVTNQDKKSGLWFRLNLYKQRELNVNIITFGIFGI